MHNSRKKRQFDDLHSCAKLRVHCIDTNNDYQTSIGFKNKGKKENVLWWYLKISIWSHQFYSTFWACRLHKTVSMWFLNDNQIYMTTKFRHPTPSLNREHIFSIAYIGKTSSKRSITSKYSVDSRIFRRFKLNRWVEIQASDS